MYCEACTCFQCVHKGNGVGLDVTNAILTCCPSALAPDFTRFWTVKKDSIVRFGAI